MTGVQPGGQHHLQSVRPRVSSTRSSTTQKDEDKNIHGDEEIRCKPNRAKTRGMRHANYEKLDETGNIPENTLVEDRDIIMAKVVPIKENKNDNSKVIKYEDHSRSYRTDEECYVDKVYMHRNGDGYRFNKVRIRTLRKPVIGDKFSSRGAQKGTIGTILDEADVPYTASGLRPDIIINPHCMPSRMTLRRRTLSGRFSSSSGYSATAFVQPTQHRRHSERAAAPPLRTAMRYSTTTSP